MRFNSHNFHESSSIEKFASNLSAIEYFIQFRKSHKSLFNIIVAVMVIPVILFLCVFVYMHWYKTNVITASVSAFVIFTVFALLGFKIYTDKRRKQGEMPKTNTIIKPIPSAEFMKRINQGFRVYDAYYVEGQQTPFKFSVLSKKPMTIRSISRLANMSRTFSFIIKNIRATQCNHIIYKEEELLTFDNITGKTAPERFCPAKKISWDEYNKALKVHNNALNKRHRR